MASWLGRGATALVLAGALVAGCPTSGTVPLGNDLDGDGFAGPPDGPDCNDLAASAYPGGVEVCDGLDNDCNGEVDDGVLLTFYPDRDGDGFGDEEGVLVGCAAGSEYIDSGGDCDDSDPEVHPLAEELCDGLDNDCDGTTDVDATDGRTWTTDADGDGYGDETSEVVACTQPEGATARGGDCDDSDPERHPGAAEIDCTDPVDRNCDGVSPRIDLDADGAAACEECDDEDPLVHPGAEERCNGQDDDCDGTIDEGLDRDGDTWTSCAGDCDDSDPDIRPGAPEGCGDSIDRNCDGLFGSPDGDGDGFGACDDCDDGDPSIHPGAVESCNLQDDDCDGSTDEDFDEDGDGWSTCSGDCDDADPETYPGAPEACVGGVDRNCDGAVGRADRDFDGADACDDCDDSDPTRHPGATETCDAVDNDCDGLTDEGFDGDGDGWTSCLGDCDDTTPLAFPGAEEACDAETDLNCDGVVGGPDGDGDGVPACLDCHDGDPTIHPGAEELCNGLDDDCDGEVDDGSDGDGDGWTGCAGDCDDSDSGTYPGAPEVDCTDPVDRNCDGHVSFTDADGDGAPSCVDCDDTDPTSRPGAAELCDLLDNDCDGEIDEDSADADGDGWSACDGDCDDTDPTISPDVEEIPYDGVDNDCDGEELSDVDGDGWDGPEGVGPDCDDADPDSHPDVEVDIADGLDNDCDGEIDEGPFSLSYNADIRPIFELDCTSSLCHDASRPAARLDLTGDAWSRIVGVPSDDVPGDGADRAGRPLPELPVAQAQQHPHVRGRCRQLDAQVQPPPRPRGAGDHRGVDPRGGAALTGRGPRRARVDRLGVVGPRAEQVERWRARAASQADPTGIPE